MINEGLPRELRDYDRVLDRAAINALLKVVAETRPEDYSKVAKHLSDVGRDTAFTMGGYSFGPGSLKTTVAARQMRQDMGRALKKIYANPNLSEAQREEAITELAANAQVKLTQDVYQEALKTGNPLALMAKSGTRGNPAAVNSFLGADLLYTNHRDEPIPLPVMRSYSQGLRPVDYFAGSFGARKGIMDLAGSTQDAGFFAKQLFQANHRLLVSDLDDKDEYDETVPRGLPVDANDPDNAGGLLAHPVGGYKRNTVLTPKILKDLTNRGHARILVRSPTVGGPRDGGVYARDVGVRERGGLAPLGDYVGVAAAQAIAEPITQAQIGSKHTGGVAGAAGSRAISGFKRINQFVQVPRVFRDGAAHAQRDGRVTAIEDAPQGGQYVTVGGHRHYVSRSTPISVKIGDEVEAGDVLSEGLPNPAQIVKHKGLGAGREYFVRTFRQAIKDSSINVDRRNVELLSRGLLNHVRLREEMGDWSPDEVVPYHMLERMWTPRAGGSISSPAASVGKYLERPVLHYTIGTKIQRSMLPMLNEFGVKQVSVHADPPPFEPEMIRGMANIGQDPDWMVPFLGSYQKTNLLKNVQRGAVSDTMGTSFVPALAAGETFGKAGPTKGWQRDAKLTP